MTRLTLGVRTRRGRGEVEYGRMSFDRILEEDQGWVPTTIVLAINMKFLHDIYGKWIISIGL